MYPMTVVYYQGGGGQSLEVQYSIDGSNWTDMPNSMTASGTPLYNNALNVLSDSNIDVAATSIVAGQFASLSIGDVPLHITGTAVGSGVTINGTTTLTGTLGPTFDVQGVNNLQLSGNITGPGGATTAAGILKINNGTLVLSGANSSYSGGTTIGLADGTFGGTVAATTSGALGTAASPVLINNGILDIQATYTEPRQITLAHANSTIQVDSPAFYTIGNAVPLAFTNGNYLTKTGTGTLGVNSTTLPASTNVVMNAGALDLGATTVPMNTLTLNGGAVNNGTITSPADYTALNAGTINAVLGGTSAVLKQTAGLVKLTNAGNNYTGGTTVSAGTLQVAQGGIVPSATVVLSGGTYSLANPIGNATAGLVSTYYGGQGNGMNFNINGTNPNQYDINNLNFAQFNADMATQTVGLTTNTTACGRGSFFTGSGSAQFDAPYNVDGADNFIVGYRATSTRR